MINLHSSIPEEEQFYCRHSLCNAHLLRDLVFVAEVSPEQKGWTEPLSKLLLKIKRRVEKAKSQPEAELTQRAKTDFLRRYDRLVRQADRLNPPPPKGTTSDDSKKQVAPFTGGSGPKPTVD